MRGMRALAIGGFGALVIGATSLSTAALPAGNDVGTLIAAYNSSGQRLFQGFAKDPSNIVLSPYSIGTAMAMALAGARGDNETEMAKVLGMGLSLDQLNDANAAVVASLNKASSASLQLNVANALMLAKDGNAISEDYVSLLRDKYGADVFRDANLSTVNNWVKQKTNGKIPSILDRFDPNTALVLLDAIYFKAKWQSVFSPRATRDATFHLIKGDAQVPTMHVRANFALAERPGYRAIRMPYEGGRVSMVVVLPDAGNADLAQKFDSAELQSLLAALHASTSAQSVDLSLPRFHGSFNTSLVEPFAAMGMHRAFDPRTADFSGMTGKPQSQLPLAIGQIVHRAVIDVAEEGTEAAAATGIAIVATAMRPQQAETFNVDRPFLFAIVDDETGAVLFEGRIVDPR
jgi:serpin B